MKNIILAGWATVALFACKSKSSTDSQANIEAVKQMTIDSMQAVNAKNKAIDSTKNKTIDSMRAIEPRHVAINTPVRENTSSHESNKQPAVTEQKKKKGWSSTAKGAVIGAGTGAIAGAIIDKKHGQGAIIGTVLGAGAGAATGAVIKKNKKNKKKNADSTNPN